jgi:hypothetical protein
MSKFEDPLYKMNVKKEKAMLVCSAMERGSLAVSRS